MDWRKFKRLPAVEKVEKVEKPLVFTITPPFSTLNTFSSCNWDLKKAPATVPRHRPDPPTDNEARLADEAERRADFCERHRLLLGGNCDRLDVIERWAPGDQAQALDACLLWRLIRTGQKIELAAPAEIVGAVTVGDVLAWVAVNPKDVEAIRNERRLLLTCAESME